eukprot:TRINITY_DN67803_c1_g1_i4.p1 TRINITY_DN67803_c1_g1~~TRINITY_DN67803_c1_g1_i4.p1  ORF type:complete len:151 (+),score=17.85 TRINITY_DN67803_c1_g1_i4:410-862(+)
MQKVSGQQHIRQLVPVIVESVCSYLTENWDSKVATTGVSVPFKASSDLKWMALKTAGKTNLGYDFKKGDQILEAMETVLQSQFKELLVPVLGYVRVRPSKLWTTFTQISSMCTRNCLQMISNGNRTFFHSSSERCSTTTLVIMMRALKLH